MKNEMQGKHGIIQISVANPAVAFGLSCCLHTFIGISSALPASLCNSVFWRMFLFSVFCYLNSLFISLFSNLPCLQEETAESLEIQLCGPQV